MVQRCLAPMIPALLALLALAAAPEAAAQHAHAGAQASAPPPARVDVPLDVATLAALPREAVKASAHGRELSCSGVALSALLRHAGAMPAEPLRGAHLAQRVQADARDGYRVTFSLAELDPTLGDRRVLVVDRCDDKPLPADEGPLRLIVPQDARPARWIRQLERLTVLSP